MCVFSAHGAAPTSKNGTSGTLRHSGVTMSNFLASDQRFVLQESFFVFATGQLRSLSPGTRTPLFSRALITTSSLFALWQRQCIGFFAEQRLARAIFCLASSPFRLPWPRTEETNTDNVFAGVQMWRHPIKHIREL